MTTLPPKSKPGEATEVVLDLGSTFENAGVKDGQQLILEVLGEVSLDEERSDELTKLTLGTKITRARTFVQDAPPP